MITPGFAQSLSLYNTWQNANIYDASSRLSDDARKQDRGAFFGSVHATLNHVLWADQMWLMRFGAAEAPFAKTIADGLKQFENWDELRTARSAFDERIESWAKALSPADLEGDLTWVSGGTGRTMVTPKWLTVTHLFNHQTHHRGQVHALLTGVGIKPGMTDLPFRDGV